jgi:hypothetical protein
MVTYQDFAKDLRTLAAMLDHLAPDLPLPQYAYQGLSIGIHVAEALDVVQAAKALETEVEIRGGHTTTDADIDTVHLSFVHVSDAVMAEHDLRQAYARTMPVAQVSS